MAKVKIKCPVCDYKAEIELINEAQVCPKCFCNCIAEEIIIKT